MFLSRFPLPSIHHVLETELHGSIPTARRPSVIILLEHDKPDSSPAVAAAAATSTLPIATIGSIAATSHLMKTIDLRDVEFTGEEDEEQLSFIVHLPDEEETDAADSRTIFKEKRPSTSRGLRHDPERGLGSSSAKDSAKFVINTARKVLPVKMFEVFLRRMNRH